MTSLLFTSSKPVFTVDGEVRGELARDLLRLDVEETIDGLRSLVARLAGHGPFGSSPAEREIYLDGSLTDFGKPLEVSLGPPEGEHTVFNGLVSGIEASYGEAREPEVVVFAEDRLMSLRMTRRMRSYEQMSDAEIAKAIASEHGLAAETDASGPTYDIVQQWNMSDLAFLRQRAQLIQAELWIEGDTLHFESRGSRGGAEITLVQGNELIEARLRADLAHQRTGVRVSGYDARERDAIDEEAGAEVIQAEVSEGRTGPEILERAFGARVSYRVREAPLADGEAQEWARAEMLRRSRGFVTVIGTTNGTPEMGVGSRLTLDRVGMPFEGSGYHVTRVHHSYDNTNGHRTHFEAERPTIAAGGGRGGVGGAG